MGINTTHHQTWHQSKYSKNLPSTSSINTTLCPSCPSTISNPSSHPPLPSAPSSTTLFFVLIVIYIFIRLLLILQIISFHIPHFGAGYTLQCTQSYILSRRSVLGPAQQHPCTLVF